MLETTHIHTSIVCSVVGVVLIFAHNILVDPTDPDLHISNNMFIRLVVLLGLSTYITLRFFSKESSSIMGMSPQIDTQW